MARQARTTENLKQRIADALLDLLAERPLTEISVSAITDRADVGRATYYRHFASKKDVITYKLQTIFEPLFDPAGSLAEYGRQHSPTQLILAYTEHLLDHKAALETIYGAGLGYMLFAYLYYERDAQGDDDVARYRHAIRAAMLFAITDQWITSGFAKSPSDLARLLTVEVIPHHGHAKFQPAADRSDARTPN
ncbi:MAG: TetR family transcriptional regulator [Actinomycetaceae bacterium]|nr:TetR family transcriptional regulator [Actinomycetaceae bacterium]